MMRFLSPDLPIALPLSHNWRCQPWGGKNLLVSLRIFQQLLHHAKQVFCLVCRYAVESESAWLLALAVEVSKETVHQVTVAVKAQEVGRILRLGGHSLRGAVSAESGDDADLARLLVTNYQHVLFITLFLLLSLIHI